jgi:hypothetical protein
VPGESGGSAPRAPTAAPTVGPAHVRRLRALWRSAGWPAHDLVEAELLVAGLVDAERDAAGRETLRVTPAGLRLIVDAVQRHRRAYDAHEALVARVAAAMQRSGRIVWRGLGLRAPPSEPDGTRWTVVRPDVYSIRHTTREDWVEPVVHEVKVRRADLLADLRRQAKRAAYEALSSQCWYVLGPGVGGADDVPASCGVMIAGPGGLEVARPAPQRALRLSLLTWMALARATAEPPMDEDAQAALGEPAAPAPNDGWAGPECTPGAPPRDPPP